MAVRTSLINLLPRLQPPRSLAPPRTQTLSPSVTHHSYNNYSTTMSSDSDASEPPAPAEKKHALLLRRPKRIILIRHGESTGNEDASAYTTTPDWRIPLTPQGRTQATTTGEALHRLIGTKERIAFYYSPYIRTRETLTGLREHLNPSQIISVREEPRISEQQFGNFQNEEEVSAAKLERHNFGRFYYRFPSGESGLDVYSRVSSFIATLFRDWRQYSNAGKDLDNVNVVIVTHGLCLRLFLMRWYQLGVEEFEETYNPENAQMIVMRKRVVDGLRWFEVNEADRKSLNLPEKCGRAWTSEWSLEED